MANPERELPPNRIIIFKLHGGFKDGVVCRTDRPESVDNPAKEMWGLSRGATIGHTFGFGSDWFGERGRREGFEAAETKYGTPPLYLYRIDKAREEGNQIIVDCQFDSVKEQRQGNG
jgi:hypothetical protein